MSRKKHKHGAPPNRTTGNGPDGYIIERNGEIRQLRQTIRCKYLATLLIAVFIPIWIFGIACYQWQSPENWTQIEIVYSHLSRESIGMRRGVSAVLNAADGRKFVVQKKKISFRDLGARLNPGEGCALIYSKSIAGGDILEALSDDRGTVISLEDSVAQWEEQRAVCVAGLWVTCGIEIVALILIDRLWCRKEYAKIRLQKEKIRQREERMRQRAEEQDAKKNVILHQR